MTRILISSPELHTTRGEVVNIEQNMARELAVAIKEDKVNHENVKIVLQSISQVLEKVDMSLVNVLPLMFNLSQKPYDLQGHYFFEPLFSTRIATNSVICSGRQVGKCTLSTCCIRLYDNSQLTIKEIVENRVSDPILTYDVQQGQFIKGFISDYFNTGIKQCFELVTKSGHVVGSTKEHKYLTRTGWTELGDLIVGDEIAIFIHPGQPVLWDEIVSIEDMGLQDTYDIEVETHHNYVANNIVSHNSMTIASSSVAFAHLIPYMRILTVTPLFEQVRRLSQNYVKPFIFESPIRGLMVNTQCSDSILQRDFANHSILYFSYAFTSVTRCRGISTYAIQYDELGDFDPEYPPIINRCADSAPSHLRFIRRFGTPKTMDNTMEQYWAISSKAEWCIRCSSCGHWNIPSLDHDLDVMIGPRKPKWKVSKETPAIICAGKSKVDSRICGKPLNTRQGMWVHARPDKRWSDVGYHIPQIVLPMHCEDAASWRKILDARDGADNMTPAKFYNEVCGVSYDGSSKLITLTELKKACFLPTDVNKIQEAVQFVKEKLDSGIYQSVVLGVDWGGGGAKELSFTTICVAALRHDGKIDIPFGYRSLTPHDHEKEIALIINLKNMFHASVIVHDGNGSGPARETQLKMMGMPEQAMCRMFYIRLGRGHIIKWVPGDMRTGEKSGYNLDKARGLMWLVSLIKQGYVRFFKYDTIEGGKLGLIDDFLSLVEDKHTHSFASDVYTIIRSATSPQPDDFTAACCYATHFFYGHVLKNYPQIQYLAHSRIEELKDELINAIEGTEEEKETHN